MFEPSSLFEKTPMRLGLAAAAGLIGSFGQAPYSFAPATFLMLVLTFFLYGYAVRPKQAFVLGWGLGASYFAVSMRWIVEPFQVDAAAHGWMAPFALLFLSTGLAVIWGAAFALARRCSGAGWPLVFGWALAEMFRAYALTGFPWANPAQGLLESWAGQALAWIGPHGLTLVAMGAACITVQRARPLLGFGALALILVALSLPVIRPEAALTEKTARLVQPNAPQEEKWDPDKAHIFVERQLEMTARPGDADLIIWSEMSIPYRMSVAGSVFDAAGRAGRGAPVLMGAMRDVEGQFFNAALLISPQGEVVQHYNKHHLVPFGEYMPLPNLFRALGIRALAERTETGYTPGAGPQLMDLGDLGQGLLLICYEAVFPQDLRGTARPDVLINMTNDAWFGQTLGPQQHLALARMRAIEQGLPMLRVAGTGISGVIDPYGRVLGSMPLNVQGVLDVAVPAPLPVTLYARMGDMPWLIVMLLGLIWAAALKFRAIDGTGKAN